MHRKLLAVALLALIVAVSTISCKTEKTIHYEKLTSKSEVPAKILDSISKMTHLDRGMWEFTGEYYETNDLYFLICGGEKYLAGYDIDVDRIDSRPKSTELHVVKAVYFRPHIKEMATDSTYDYCEGAKYPFVIFKIVTRFGPDDEMQSYAKTLEGEEIEKSDFNFPFPKDD